MPSRTGTTDPVFMLRRQINARVDALIAERITPLEKRVEELEALLTAPKKGKRDPSDRVIEAA